MNALAIAQLIEALLPQMIGLYNTIRTDNAAANLKSIEEIIAQANANDDAVIARADAELAKNNPPA